MKRYQIDFMPNEADELSERLIISALSSLIFELDRRVFYPKGLIARARISGELCEIELLRDVFQVRESEWLVGGERFAIEGALSDDCFGVSVVAAFHEVNLRHYKSLNRQEVVPSLTLHYVNVNFNELETASARYLATHIGTLLSENELSSLKFRQTLCLYSELNNPVYVDLRLSDRLEVRPSKKHPTETRYAIVGKSHGKGRTSSVSLNPLTLRVREGQFHATQKVRVLHEMFVRKTKKNPSADPTLVSGKLKENDLFLQKLSFLKAKPSYMVEERMGAGVVTKAMRFEKCMPGDTVRAWILNNNRSIRSMGWSFERSTQVAIAALRALKTQVHDNGVIHCDVKPENIMVHCPDVGEVEVNFIDYDLSCLQGAQVCQQHIVGTPLYVPLEIWTFDDKNPVQYENEKRDIFSLGVTLGEVFGASLDHFTTPGQLIKAAENYAFKDLFRWMGDIPDDLKEEVKSLLLAMVCRMPDDRPDLLTTAAQFESVLVRYREWKVRAQAPSPT